MTNLDNRIQNPDQVLTQDVDKLCDSLVELYSNLSKVLMWGGAYVWGCDAYVGWCLNRLVLM